MTTTSPPHRLLRGIARIRPYQWVLISETLLTLTLASAAIQVVPFRRLMRFAARPLGVGRADRDVSIPELLWVLETVSRRVPWRTVCFQKGLALHRLLRRRGVASHLHYGVGRNDEDGLAAHVWISVDGVIILGGDVAERFHCLAIYPEPRA